MKCKLIQLNVIAIVLLCCMGFKSKPPAKESHLLFRFHNMADSLPLKFYDSLNVYHNANGDDYYVTTFKYYISNISLISVKGDTVAIPESYLLVNAADSLTLNQQLAAVPAGKYKGISFTIGVDSARNFSGAQTGSLDPSKGMFWTWKSGYIFVKMEGVSSKSTNKKNRLVFHIGGVSAPDNTIRTFTQNFPNVLKIKEGRTPQIDIAVNVAALFRGVTIVDFSTLNFTMGGPKSVIVADNCAQGLFNITAVKK